MEVGVKEWDDDSDEEGAVGDKREDGDENGPEPVGGEDGGNDDGKEVEPAKARPVPRRTSKKEEGRMDVLATHERGSKTGRVGGKRRFISRGGRGQGRSQGIVKSSMEAWKQRRKTCRAKLCTLTSHGSGLLVRYSRRYG